MYKVGLTGGIGSGKSTVAKFFADLGVPVIDMDIIAREIVRPGQATLQEIKSLFGHDICDSEDELDRKRLREIIFKDEVKRKQLESITHPRIRQRVDEIIQTLDAPYCIIVIPLLFESNRQDNIDRILVVDTDVEQQIRHTMQRDNIDEDYVRKIIASQASRQTRLKYADDIIDNSGKFEDLSSQVSSLHEKYLALAHKFQRK